MFFLYLLRVCKHTQSKTYGSTLSFADILQEV